MNVHQLDRRILLDHLRAVEEKFPLHFLGLLPRGTVEAFDLLAEKRDGLSLLGLAKAEVELSERIGHPVGIVLVSGLRGDYGDRVKASVRPF
ncbi:MAG: hypothetical protein ACXWU0_03695 [Rhodoplanes sp.]